MRNDWRPDKAFILAAGKGTRMKPLTDQKPKPLIEYRGRPILDHALEKLDKFGVQQVVINLHYLGDMIKTHLEDRKSPEIIFSEEDELLETGGGIKKAIGYFNEPFFVLSGDGPWEDAASDNTALTELASFWDEDKMDILMLLQPVETMTLTESTGDYDLDEQGHATRQKDKNGSYMFTSIRIVSPKIFEDSPNGAFSFLELMDRAEDQGRLYGIRHSGEWHHLSTPEDVTRVNQYYK